MSPQTHHHSWRHIPHPHVHDVKPNLPNVTSLKRALGYAESAHLQLWHTSNLQVLGLGGMKGFINTVPRAQHYR